MTQAQQAKKIFNDPSLFAKKYLNSTFWPLQSEIANSICKPHSRTAVKSCHASGKCVSMTDMLTLANGSRVEAGSLIGTTFELLTLVNGTVQKVQACAEFNAIEPVFVVETESGRRITRNAEHPLWVATGVFPNGNRVKISPRGWTPVSEIKAGDLVAVTEILPAFGEESMPLCEIKLIAYLIGDGGLTTHAGFTKSPGKQIDELRDCAAVLDCELHPTNDPLTWRIVSRSKTTIKRQTNSPSGVTTHRVNLVLELIRKHGLFGKKSIEKRIPAAIFRLPRHEIAIFLSRLYSTDGWACVGKHNIAEIGYGSSSFGLIEDVNELLLRFGVSARIQY